MTILPVCIFYVSTPPVSVIYWFSFISSIPSYLSEKEKKAQIQYDSNRTIEWKRGGRNCNRNNIKSDLSAVSKQIICEGELVQR